MVPSTVMFDLGQVVLRWVPERAFEQVMDAAEVPAFMERVEFHPWNKENDGFDDLAQNEAAWIARFPSDAAGMQAFRTYFDHTVTEMVPGTAAIMAELQQAGVGISALSNWSGELFTRTHARWGILNRFSDIVVSGREGVVKPDRRIFELACERGHLNPAEVVFIDDTAENVEAAINFGMQALQFTSGERLRADLVELGLLQARIPLNQPIYHWAPREVWREAVAAGHYPWSARGRGYIEEGFVHFSFADQLAATREKFYADLSTSELVLLRLDPAPMAPVVVENGYPHLFAPFPLNEVTEVSVDALDLDPQVRP